VFSSTEGDVLRRNNFYTRHFKPALREAGLDHKVRFHDLRHSAASIAIAMNANVKQVQQMLGHTSATVTLDTYSHVFPSLAEQLRDGLENAYQDAVSQDAVRRRMSAGADGHAERTTDRGAIG
jgi:integrase